MRLYFLEWIDRCRSKLVLFALSGACQRLLNEGDRFLTLAF